jgi:hypothetical protein
MVLCADRCVKRCDAYSCVYYCDPVLYIISDAVSDLDVADRCTDVAVSADSRTSVAVSADSCTGFAVASYRCTVISDVRLHST